MGRRKLITNSANLSFIDNAILNDLTFIDYFNRLSRIALSMFEWVNLPNSMDSRFLEKCLFEFRSSYFII